MLHYFKYAAGYAFLSSPFPAKACGILHLHSSRENSLELPPRRAFLMPKYGPRRTPQYAGSFHEAACAFGSLAVFRCRLLGTGAGGAFRKICGMRQGRAAQMIK